MYTLYAVMFVPKQVPELLLISRSKAMEGRNIPELQFLDHAFGNDELYS